LWSDGYGPLGKWEGGAYCLYIESDLEERSVQSLTRHRWSIDSKNFPSFLLFCVGVLFNNFVRVRHSHEIESADLETENNNKPLRVEEEEPVTTLSPATSSTSLYASEKFYSDAESDDEYKDPLPDVYPQSKSFHSVRQPHSFFVLIFRKVCLTVIYLFQAMNKSSNIDSGEQLHVTMAIQRLQADLQSINTRLEALELHRKELTLMENGQRQQQGSTKHSTVEQVGSFAVTYGSIPSVNQLSLPSWFPFKNVNVATIAVILGWPLLAQYLYARLHHRHSAV